MNSGTIGVNKTVTIMQDYDPADKIKTLKRLSFAVNKVKYRRDINV